MQRAVAGLVALAAHVMQACQQRSELGEILQARHVLFAHVIPAFASHAVNYAHLQQTRNTTCAGCGECANLVPNRIAG